MENNYRTIIDGYNLIFQCGLEGRSRNSLALERARDRLISVVGRSSEQDRTAIVFDAKSLPIKEERAKSQIDGLAIIFAVDFEDADELIEQLILHNSVPKSLIVVSSDHRIQKAALRRKAKPIDSDVWFDRLADQEVQSESDVVSADLEDEKPDPGQFQDIDWINEFRLNSPQDSKGPRNDGRATFDPFPPGFADDLLDEN